MKAANGRLFFRGVHLRDKKSLSSAAAAEALAPVRRIADEEILRLLAAALSALNSDL